MNKNLILNNKLRLKINGCGKKRAMNKHKKNIEMVNVIERIRTEKNI